MRLPRRTGLDLESLDPHLPENSEDTEFYFRSQPTLVRPTPTPPLKRFLRDVRLASESFYRPAPAVRH